MGQGCEGWVRWLQCASMRVRHARWWVWRVVGEGGGKVWLVMLVGGVGTQALDSTRGRRVQKVQRAVGSQGGLANESKMGEHSR